MSPGDRQDVCRAVIQRLKRKFKQIDLETAAEIQMAVDDALKEWADKQGQDPKRWNREQLAGVPQ